MPGGGKICAAFGCSNTNIKKHLKGKVSFHSFPFTWGEEYVKAWKIRLKRENFEPTRHMVVCSEHFEESCFEYQNFTGRRQLKHGSEPTIFKHNQKKERQRTSYQFK
ncbi:THAP domain-containing protein 3 [Plakobranchus ocellatus]|uniref:THAP domain-containing protein 3 n=1 Tax=Plakobranchus ocellatus TaxID=259542 RepID=A0AAV3ZYI0_9GAST|nr:THAP domain-containing protein 3 [Plakobranchus ocellatus]